MIKTASGLDRCAAALAAGTGPAGVDAERASGFRYGQRAFLVQIRREGSGTWLIDPEPFEDLGIINDALRGVEWILHAASQDLPCLSELGMWPDKLFDTELAARLAGLPRVGLAAVIEQLLGFGLAKEHSAADWSTRPLPEPWLRYAALDVEVLTELREELIELLVADGKLEYAEQEFAAILDAGQAPPRVDPWRKTSGLHQIRDRRQLAAVRELWLERDSLAAEARRRPRPADPRFRARRRGQGHAHHRAAAPRHQGLPRPRRRSARPRAGCAASAPPGPWRNCRRCTCPPTLPRPPRVWADRDPEAAARLPPPAALAGQGRGTEHAGGEPADPGLPPPRLLAPAGASSTRGTRGRGRWRASGARPWQVADCRRTPMPHRGVASGPSTAAVQPADRSGGAARNRLPAMLLDE